MGKPCKGPTAAPCANASSAAHAPAIARSGNRVTIALTVGLTRSIWVRWASITSRADSSLARIRRASSVAVMKQMSGVDMDVSLQAIAVVGDWEHVLVCSTMADSGASQYQLCNLY